MNGDAPCEWPLQMPPQNNVTTRHVAERARCYIDGSQCPTRRSGKQRSGPAPAQHVSFTSGGAFAALNARACMRAPFQLQSQRSRYKKSGVLADAFLCKAGQKRARRAREEERAEDGWGRRDRGEGKTCRPERVRTVAVARRPRRGALGEQQTEQGRTMCLERKEKNRDETTNRDRALKSGQRKWGVRERRAKRARACA